MSASRQHRDRGAVAAEAALTVPLILLLVFGIIDFGRLLDAKISVSAAAREGARAAAVGGDRDDVVSRISTIMGPQAFDPPAVSTCGSNPGADDDATVTITVPFSFVTPLGALAGIAFDGPLSSTGVMPCRG